MEHQLPSRPVPIAPSTVPLDKKMLASRVQSRPTSAGSPSKGPAAKISAVPSLVPHAKTPKNSYREDSADEIFDRLSATDKAA